MLAVHSLQVSASDNCSSVTPGMTAGLASGELFPVGTTTVTYATADEAGNPASSSFTVTVNNSDPSISSISANIVHPIVINGSLVLTVMFDDNNVKYATINWGDGNEETVSVSGNSVSVPHTYNKSNIYAPVVTITDACGLVSDSKEYQFVVVYDPNGGFVTGGGWINSPLSNLPYMSNGGQANFGFNAKYKNGKNELDQVDGNTTFHLKAGDLNFKSSSHSAMSLVIANHKATYTGEGTINGGGAYEFRVIAIDGDVNSKGAPDYFRIKIWEKGKPSVVVYDNQYGIAENIDPSGDNTKLGGGFYRRPSTSKRQF